MVITTQGARYVGGARFEWVPFYEALARALLAYQEDRAPLVNAVLSIGAPDSKLDYLTHDQFADGRTGPLEDIDPFTTLAVFNRSSGYARRAEIAAELARFLDVELAAPTEFAGIPTVDPRSSWYFGFSKDRGANDIDVLWQVFVAAARLATTDDAARREVFITTYDAAMAISRVKWNLSFGLFWSHPHRFLPMSSKAQRYFRSTLGKPLGTQPPDGRRYLALIDELREMFHRRDAPVHGFPDLALAAWLAEQAPAAEAEAPPSPAVADAPQEPAQPTAATPYTIDDIVADGCFLERAEIETALARLKVRKNLILQGPPGTGKTWLARRLAYAWVGAKDDTRVEAVQFHANSSYEDLVCGYRPGADGRLTMADGSILQAIARAADSLDRRFVLVIEEFNRGNPAHVLGELLTLLEAGQRSSEHALRLTYPDSNGRPRRLFIPENFYLIGTMNVADRSLATLDHALRRRFAFADLQPALNKHWAQWLEDHGVEAKFADAARTRVEQLNDRIASDTRLGPQYAVGHSYITPREHVAEPAAWFRAVVETEIGPLLDEYWFDEPAIAKDARERLLKDWPPL